MNNSKEALERLYLGLEDYDTQAKCYELILKELSRLENLEKENDKLKNIIKVFVGYILVCKPIDFDTYLHSLCDDTEIELITELLKEALSNER